MAKSMFHIVKNSWAKLWQKTANLPTVNNAKNGNISPQNSLSLRIQRVARTPTGLTLEDWQKAVEAALAVKAKRLLLAQLYDYALRDLHVKSEVSFRINRVLGQKWLISQNGAEADDATLLLNKEWFRRTLLYAMEALFHGHSVIEIVATENGEIRAVELIPRAHVNPLMGLVMLKPTDNEGLPYRGNLMVWEVGSIYDLGLLKDVANHAIRKIHAEQYWIDFQSRFGLPIPYATTDSHNVEELAKIDGFLEEMAAGSFSRFPSSAKIELIQPNNTDAYQLFDAYIDKKNTEISKAILGQSQLTNDSGGSGSYAKSAISKDVADEIMESDKFFLKNFVNEQVIPRLILLGYSLQNCVFEWDELEKLPILAQFQIDQGLMQAGYDLDTAYLEKTYHVKLAGKTKLPVIKNAVGANFPQPLPLSAKDGGLDLRNATAMPAIVGNEDNTLFQKFQKLAKDFHKGGDYDAAQNAFLREMAGMYDKDITEAYAAEVETAYDLADVKQLAFMKNNVFLFSAAKTESELKEMAALLLDENGKERSFPAFLTEAKKLHHIYNVQHLETEHQYAVAAAQSGAAWQDVMRTKDLFPYLIYDAVGDSRTRPEHWALNGIIVRWDSSFLKIYWTPNGWNCRCFWRKLRTGTPTPQKDLPTPELGEIFKNNVGENGIIFPESHPYFADAPKNKSWANDIQHLLDDMSWIKFRDNGKNTIEVHSRFPEDEWEVNVGFATDLQENGYNVRINKYLNDHEWAAEVPKEERKNPDARIFDEHWRVCDFKTLETGGKSAIRDFFRKANGQLCEAVVVRLDSKNLTKSDLVQALKDRNGHEKNIKKVYFIHPDGKVYGYDREGIAQRVADGLPDLP